MSAHYPWKRLWEPVATPRSAKAAGSSAVDAEGALSFDSISGTPCLVLVGEPGAGKTTTVRDIAERARNAGQVAHVVDLLSVQTRDDLDRDIFDKPWFASWIQGNDRLHLYLDSLDECQMRPGPRAAVKAIVERLINVPRERLLLRWVCKAAEVPRDLLDELDRLWSQAGEVRVYRLGLLSEDDIKMAVFQNDIDPSAFMAALHTRRVYPLAQVPMLLQDLIVLYKDEGTLPSSSLSLYEKSSWRLASASNHDDPEMAGLDASQRLAISRRMAALSRLTGRRLFRLTSNPWDNPIDLSPSDSAGGYETVGGNRHFVTESDVRLVLRTALFSAGPYEHMRWIHESHGDFLAASYLLEHGTPPAQLRDILFHPVGRLIPQLRGTALWLAQMNSGVRDALIEMDPEALLDIPGKSMPEDLKPHVVASMLRLAGEDNPSEVDRFAIRGVYSSLNHGGLSQQLRPFIENHLEKHEVRRLALEIARDCRLPELADSLANVALDDTERTDLRRIAARAAVDGGGTSVLLKLMPLALAHQDSDEGNELKGIVLRALWPNHITVAQLFQALTARDERLYFGSYWRFITELGKSLHLDAPDDVKTALLWASQIESTTRTVTADMRELLQLVASSALPYLPECSMELARLLGSSSLAWGAPGLVPHLRTNVDDRKLLMVAWMEYSKSTNYDVDTGVRSSRFLLPEDVPWLIEKLETQSTEDQEYLSRVIQQKLFEKDSEPWIPVAMRAAETYPPLGKYLTPYFGSDPDAPDMKQWRLIQGLDISNDEGDDEDRAGQPVDEASITGTGLGSLFDPWNTDLSKLGQALADKIGDDILSSLKSLIVTSGQDDPSQIAHDLEPSVLALAFYVVRQRDPEFFRSLPVETALRLSDRVVEMIAYHNVLPPDYERCLTETLFESCTPQFVAVLRDKMHEQDRAFGSSPVLNRIEAVCPKAVADGLAEDFYSDPPLQRGTLANLLGIQFRHETNKITDRVIGLLEGVRSTDEAARVRASVAIEVLLLHSQDVLWTEIWSAIREDPGLGREAMLHVADNYLIARSANFLAMLKEQDLSDLYRWLMDNFPIDRYPPARTGFRMVGPEEEIASLRDEYVPAALVSRDSSEAVRELDDLLRSFPDAPKLRGMRELAIRQARQRWEPIEPKQFLRWIGERDARFVLSSEHLVTVIEESVGRLEVEFRRQDTPMAIVVWNEVSQEDEPTASKAQGPDEKKKGRGATRYTPKDENRLSDYIKNHLEKDLKGRGIIVNRETEVLRMDSLAGRRTDLRVEAFRLDNPVDRLAVVIEVKGSWNDEAPTGMEAQLVGNYLRRGNPKHGLYLVGWFACKKWDESGDYRAKTGFHRPEKFAGYNLERTRQFLNGEATRLSQDGIKVRSIVLNASLSDD